CVVVQAAACAAQNGVYHGNGSACAGANCPPATLANGGFETGDFTGWTQFGNLGYTAVNTGSFSGVSPHGGTYEAHFGPVTTTGGIQQTVTANAGDTVTVDF